MIVSPVQELREEVIEKVISLIEALRSPEKWLRYFLSFFKKGW